MELISMLMNPCAATLMEPSSDAVERSSTINAEHSILELAVYSNYSLLCI